MANRNNSRWKKPELKEEGPLGHGVWYRSPWWTQDHLLGRSPEHILEQLAWCGRPLEAARYWDDPEYGGLWVSERTSAKCADCARYEKEWKARGSN